MSVASEYVGEILPVGQGVVEARARSTSWSPPSIRLFPGRATVVAGLFGLIHAVQIERPGGLSTNWQAAAANRVPADIWRPIGQAGSDEQQH